MRHAAWGMVAAVTLLSVHAAAQTALPCDVVNPETSGAYLDVRVTTVPEGYRYEYLIANPASSTGCIRHFGMDVSSRSQSPAGTVVAGPGVRGNEDAGVFTVPGTYSALALRYSLSEVDTGWFFWRCAFPLAFIPYSQLAAHPEETAAFRACLVDPGETLAVATIVSPLPPGPRRYRMMPQWNPRDPATRLRPADPDDGLTSVVEMKGATLGPVHPEELALYNGGGQKPVDVNTFLSYSSPVEARTKLKATQTAVTIAVKYGASTLPATFHAELNGADVTARFAPATGRLEGVILPLGAGSNTLVLRVDGTTGSGRTATDTDRLVFLVGQ